MPVMIIGGVIRNFTDQELFEELENIFRMNSATFRRANNRTKDPDIPRDALTNVFANLFVNRVDPLVINNLTAYVKVSVCREIVDISNKRYGMRYLPSDDNEDLLVDARDAGLDFSDFLVHFKMTDPATATDVREILECDFRNDCLAHVWGLDLSDVREYSRLRTRKKRSLTKFINWLINQWMQNNPDITFRNYIHGNL
jgi:hypothetical protein